MVVEHAREPVLQVDAFRRGVDRLGFVEPVVVVDGADQPRAVMRALHQMMEQEGHGGLAIGAGDSGDTQIPARVTADRCRRFRHGAARIRGPQPGDRSMSRSGLRQDRRGALPDRLINELEAIGLLPAQRAIERARADPPGIACDRGHLGPGRPSGSDIAQFVDKIRHFHTTQSSACLR